MKMTLSTRFRVAASTGEAMIGGCRKGEKKKACKEECKPEQNRRGAMSKLKEAKDKK